MNEPDDGRPGGPDTPPAPVPAPEAKGDDASAGPPTTAEPAASAAGPASAATIAPAPAPTPEPAPAVAPAPTAAPVPAPAAAPAPAPAPVAAPAPVPAPIPVDGYEGLDDYVVPRWISLVTTVGAGLIGVVTLQVVLTLVEGLSLKKGERFSIPDDFIHRIGYPFGSLGSTAVFFVLLGVVLLVLPTILGEEVTDRQYAVAGAALRTAIVVGVLVGVGSLLAVRGSLHEYSAKDVAVQGYVRVQFTNFLLATLAASALTVYGALAALRLRDEG